MFCLVVALASASPPSHSMSYTSLETTPWPRPAAFTNGTAVLKVGPAANSLTITTTSKSELLTDAIKRYTEAIEQSSAHSPAPPSLLEQAVEAASVQVRVEVSSDSEILDDKTDESYTLKLATDGIGSVTAPSVFGAMRGLESIAQLFESSESNLVVRGLPWSITDKPRYSHRGTLVDTSRHFLPLEALKTHIDAMAYTKLNVLHWHLLDFQSFPLASSAVPSLVKGAYSPHETYSLQQLSEVVRYGKARGVRVMVEVDTPGHSASWGVGEPSIMTQCPQVRRTANGANQMTFDPSVNRTFEVLEKILTELGQVFTDSSFHLGGDEVHFACWNESVRVRTFMRQQGMGADFAKLEAYYLEKLLAIAARAIPNRTLMMYQEVFDNNITLPDKVVFGVWKHTMPIPAEVAAIAKAGHQVVLANGNNGEWYLNDGFGSGPRQIGHLLATPAWNDVYSLDPLNGTNALLTPVEQERVIGGEVSLWGEEINANNLQQKAWPRGAAFAERMWSPDSFTKHLVHPTAPGMGEVGARLARMYCKLTARGILASPISPGSCYAVAS